MKSIIPSKDSIGVEVTNITKHGLWLLTRDNELFISLKEFPRFRDASVSKIMNVEQPNPTMLRWPELDIDLAVASVRCFPLMSKKSLPTARPGRQTKTEPTTQSQSGLCSDTLRTSPKEQRTNLPRIPHFPNAINHVQGDEGGTAQSTD